MDRVIDRTATDGAVLDRTESDGVLGRSLLCSPLSTHLRETERARYVAWNKKRGVTCIHGGPDTYTPSGSYRAFAVATDTRLLFVVGGDGSDGDRVFSLPYSDVLTVETTANFLASTLELVAEGKQRWQFACRGDLDPVAGYVDEAVQCWTRAETLFDRADDRVCEARNAVEDGRLDTAVEALDAAETHLADARDHLGELGPGAVARGTAAADDIEHDAADTRGRLAATRGARAHESARTAWDDGEYAAAYDAYERAREAYQRARSLGVSDLPLEERLATVDGECEQLARAPIERAREAADAARAADDEQATIEHWETALERYRTALALDWGRDRRFDGDPEQLRTAVTDTATAVVDARRRVAQDRLDLSDWLAKSGDEEGARAALREARDHFERAHEVAAELVPDRRDRTTEDMASVAERVARLDADRGASDTEV
ncbi:hypothetical protein [Haloarcula pelagica]|uniref:hypothetical protein n=1 Tax=Haloarcula pelagica TaxID=3033389 RepID=UPI0024C35979|nr:hypothetical protein [Halomicroarcula sp. YJ-61-S]